ncbi:hypothetical protein K474DRAFT_1585283 [Panus rudis PR-1116 ss-1]|nr:hypothetical protein K474DRAFT_1585283 [Panus rudis PR-1116 ss-1]
MSDNNKESTKKIRLADGAGVPVEPTVAAAQEHQANSETVNDAEELSNNATKGENTAGARQLKTPPSLPDRNKGLRKLAPPRPYPTVPTSVSATGPRSSHSEGKNRICITRKTPLGAYLRRCKDIILKDGYKSLYLNAMGAAIPHLVQLAVALPPILPHAPEEIHTEILTGTVEVQDELIPEDEDEDVSYRTRGKSTMQVVIKIGDGVDEVLRKPGPGKSKQSAPNAPQAQPKKRENNGKRNSSQAAQAPEPIVVREEDMDQD